MTDILDRTVGPIDIPAGASVLFTALPGHTYTIKSISVVNPTGGDIAVALGINGAAAGDLFLPPVVLAAGEWCDYDGILIVANGDTIDADATLDGLTFTANGLDQS